MVLQWLMTPTNSGSNPVPKSNTLKTILTPFAIDCKVKNNENLKIENVTLN